MNNINKPDAGLSRGAGFLTQDTLGNDLGNKRGLDRDLLEGESLDFDEESTETSSTATGRQADLLRSFRAAIHGSKHKNDEKDQDAKKEQTSDLRTLAVAEQRLWTGLPSPADVTPTANEGSASSTEDIVASITEAIDRSIRAEMAPRPGAPLDLKIVFHDESLGLAGLRISVTPTTLDIVLERVGSLASEELVRAANKLAERLMIRFSRKVVRIFDKQVPDEQPDLKQSDAAITAPFKPFL
jgi:hypothetical protein